MAFCKQCGAELGGAKFCANCGASAQGEVVAATNTAMDVRQRSLSDMENMIKYFSYKQPTYDEFDVVAAEFAERSEKSYSGLVGAAIISIIIGIFSGAAFFFIAGAGFIVLSIVLSKKNKEKLAIVQDKLIKIDTELTEYYEAYGYCPVGIEYVRPAILKELHSLIRKGRASNPADAINIYLADLNQAEMLRLQKETADAAKETEKASKRTASYSTASFWLKK